MNTKTITYDPALWQLVPIEPDAGMVSAACVVEPSKLMFEILRAAIAAAPSAPEQPHLSDIEHPMQHAKPDAPEPGQEGLTDERALFESHPATRKWNFSRWYPGSPDNGYSDCETELAWRGWMLRASINVKAYACQKRAEDPSNERAACSQWCGKADCTVARALLASQPADTVPMPQNADQAAAMLLLGEQWLRSNAPERLKASQPAAPVAAIRDAALEEAAAKCDMIVRGSNAPLFRSAVKIAAADIRALKTEPSTAPVAAVDEGIELVAKLIEKKIEAYDSDHGNTDPDTGVREYPGDGIEWVHEMDELVEEIRALKSAPIAAPVEAATPAPGAVEELRLAHERLTKHCVAYLDKGLPMTLVARIDELYSWYYAAIQPESTPAQAVPSESDYPVFPPMPKSVYTHSAMGPMFDRLAMQFYAAQHAEGLAKLLDAAKAAQGQDGAVAVDGYLAEDGVEHSHHDYGRGVFFTCNCMKQVYTRPQPPARQLTAVRLTDDGLEMLRRLLQHISTQGSVYNNYASVLDTGIAIIATQREGV